jgi:hypothetical protein
MTKTLLAVDEETFDCLNKDFRETAKTDAQKMVEEARREIPEEIKNILLNIMYWESCPQKYIEIISEYTGISLDEEEE